MRVFRYGSPLLLFLGAWQAFHITGWMVWLPLVYAFGLMPLLELLLKPDPGNLNEEQERSALANKGYDLLLYSVVVLQYALLLRFLFSFSQPGLPPATIAGRIAVMGLLCGVFGINVGHELGHRKSLFERTLAQLLLLTSQYLHFYIEHNKGHHRRVATPEDPASARFGESVYHFYARSIGYSYLSAWRIAAKDARKKGKAAFSWHNEMIRFTFIQIVCVAAIVFFFGWFVTACYLAVATIGILLLETVNYIEHYGLSRQTIEPGKYERTNPSHSWNSNHWIGRVMLFELSRHSDHHYLASRKYQVLRHHDASPQMPTGYPGMMLLSLLPPAWFRVMNGRVRRVMENHGSHPV